MANLVHLTNLSLDNIWKIVKNIKLATFDTFCGEDQELYTASVWTGVVAALEQQLNIEPSETIVENITRKQLDIAGQFFLYLNSCPYKLKPWILFYRDVFKNYSPDQIVLALNRIMKITPNVQNHVFQTIAQKLFKKAAIQFSLNYKNIQSMIPQNTEIKMERWNLPNLFIIGKG